MTDPLFVRFVENERYDIVSDSGKVVLLAITPSGSFHSEVDAEPRSKLRERRKAFQDYVFGAMSLGQLPHEVLIG